MDEAPHTRPSLPAHVTSAHVALAYRVYQVFSIGHRCLSSLVAQFSASLPGTDQHRRHTGDTADMPRGQQAAGQSRRVGRGRERAREKKRDRETERQRETERETERDRERERERKRQRERQRDRERDRDREIEGDRERQRETERERQRDRERGRRVGSRRRADCFCARPAISCRLG